MLVHDQLVQPTTDSNLSDGRCPVGHHAAAPEREVCRSCRVVKPIVDYAVDRSRRTGYAGHLQGVRLRAGIGPLLPEHPRGRLTA